MLLLAGCRSQVIVAPAPVHFAGMTMGTAYSVKLARLPRGMTSESVQAEIDGRLERLNDLMSTYRPESEISRLSRAAAGSWIDVSPKTATVLAEALRISRLTDGAFDITVAPLVNLWNFGPGSGAFRIPSDQAIASARASVGFTNIELRLEPPSVRKRRDDTTLDLSAIAKGFAVDQIADYLESLDGGGYLVEIGGETRTRGTKSDGTPWRVGIERPVEGRIALERAVELGDRAMATSGDYRNYFEWDGQRYSHTIDPRTGRPVEFQLASVSVVSESCMTADALATSIMVLGPEAGYTFAVQQRLAVLLIVRDGQSLVEKATPEFVRLFGSTP